jgi:hypothetical protein
MRVNVECKIERPSTGSTLTTGIAFNSKKEESREDHVLAVEKMVEETFPGWQLRSATWIKANR